MKRLAFGAAAAGGAALALHHFAPKVREMHANCREMMRTRCAAASDDEPGPAAGAAAGPDDVHSDYAEA